MDFLGRPFYLLGGGGGGGGTGNVTGPNSSTIDAIPRFATNTGKSIKNSPVTVSDTGRVQGVSVIETDFVESSTNPLTLQSQTGVKLISPISSVEVNTDVVLDAGGTVSLTGRATPIAIAINGSTVLTGSLSLTGQILMNGFSQIKGVALPSLPQDAATKEYVDNIDAVKWAQLLYNSIVNQHITISGQLDTNDYYRLLPIVNDPIPANYYISSFNINTVDNIGFVLLTTGTYKIRYRIGVRSDNATLQTLSVALRIDNIIRLDTEQFILVSNAAYTYHDFEYIYTNTIPNIDIILFAKVSSAPTAILTSYLCFNVIEI